MSRQLCSGCRTIDLRKYIYESKFLNTNPLASLGSWEQICKRTRCPLCRLVQDALLLHDCKPSPKSMIVLSNRKSWKCCTSYNEYHGVRWEDYSNEYDLQVHAERTGTESRYQFVVGWERGPTDFVEVLLRPLREGPFFGRPVDQEHADLSLCDKWLDLCHDYHNVPRGRCIGKKTSRRFLAEQLRLIDIDKMKIITGLTAGACCVALSYVWGEDKMKRRMPQSLRAAVQVDADGVETIELPEKLAATVRDAIEVTRSIRYHYLWVDSLCIVQDDEADKDIQLGMMGEIYSNANLTIVAGSGPPVNGVELAVAFLSFQELHSRMGLVWDTRGWALQEKLLSKRLLIFTKFQMYLRCANSVCTEDVAMEAGALSDSIKKRPNPFKWGAQRDEPGIVDQFGNFIILGTLKLTDKHWDLTFLPDYVALIQDYSQRKLTNKYDTLKAIQGVLETWSTSDYDFPGGLPRTWLSDTLLWQPRDGSTYYIDQKSSAGFPTWSWAAWSLRQGCVWSDYTKGIARRDQKITIHTEETGSIDSVRSYCMKPQLTKIWTSSKGTPDPLSGTARQQLKTSGILLSFKTPVHMFCIGEATEGKIVSPDALQPFYLLDDNNQRVGKIWTNIRQAQVPYGRKFIALSFRTTAIALEDAVAKEYIPKEMVPLPGYTNTETGKQYPGPIVEMPLPIARWRVINVMLVEWKDDVAFRVAIGQVISTAWRSGGERLVYLG